MNGQQAKIRFRSFVWLCLKQAVKGSWEKADSISVLVGLILGAIAYFLPAVEENVTRLLLIVPLTSLASVTVARLFLSPFLVYRSKEAEAHVIEDGLRRVISEHEEAIRKRDDAIRVLNEKPKRTAAEQHHY